MNSMNKSTFDKSALLAFTARWLQQFDFKTNNSELFDLPSPCVTNIEQTTVFWHSVLIEPAKNLSNVEQVIGITLHPSAHIFYGSQYAADMQATFSDMTLTLIQIWNDEDFSRLEQNLINHLSMQKKLKRHPTIFIASTIEDSEIISLNNVTGDIVKESLITGELTILAENLAAFLEKLNMQ